MDTKQMYLDNKHPNRPGTKLSKVTGVVVHWTANESKGSNAVANRNYFNRKYRVINSEVYETYNDANNKPVSFRKASAHLNVDDTTLIENLPWKKGQAEMGYHVGATSYMTGILKKLNTTYPNNCTIGLEICVNSDGDFKKAYANGVQVTAMMLKEHGLTINDLYRHYDITGKLCPGFFTDNGYAKKYLNTTKDVAWKQFQDDVAAALNGKPAANPTPAQDTLYKVYQAGKLYKYQFAQDTGAVNCAKQLFRDSGGKDDTIYAINPNGNPLYTPSKHPEDFPEFQKQEEPKVVEPPKVIEPPVVTPPPTEVYRVFKKNVQQAAFVSPENAMKYANDMYVAAKDETIEVRNPKGNTYYTPSKHPENFK